MTIVNFLNPDDEQIDVDMPAFTPDKLLENIIQDHVNENSLQEKEKHLPESPPIPSIQQALAAISTIVQFVEGQTDMDSSQLRQLERLERDLIKLQAVTKVQNTLDGYFS